MVEKVNGVDRSGTAPPRTGLYPLTGQHCCPVINPIQNRENIMAKAPRKTAEWYWIRLAMKLDTVKPERRDPDKPIKRAGQTIDKSHPD